MLVTCAYYAFKVNLLCSIMLQKLINNDGKYSKKMIIIKESKFYIVIQKRGQFNVLHRY